MKQRKIKETIKMGGPAAFRRLCVETQEVELRVKRTGPAAFRRLCVETRIESKIRLEAKPSRLQAAVC